MNENAESNRERLLGAILADIEHSDGLVDLAIKAGLRASDLGKTGGRIWTAIKALQRAKRPYDLPDLTGELAKSEGDLISLSELVDMAGPGTSQGRYLLRDVIGTRVMSGTGTVEEKTEHLRTLEEVLAAPVEYQKWTARDLGDILPAMDWLWPSWMPRGLLTELVGEQEIGKSNLALALAACVIRGDPWPDGTKAEGEGVVLWIDTEASQALLCDRVQKWGLPPDSVILPGGRDPLDDIQLDDPDDWRIIENTILIEKPQLVVVDSFSGAYRKNENSPEANDACHRLATLARNHNIAVLVTHHLRKAGMLDSVEIGLDRVRGHSAITQYARVILAIDAPDNMEKENKRLLQIKNNLMLKPEPVGFLIGDGGLSFGDAPERPRIESQLERAKDMLSALLAKGPKAASEIEEEMKGAAISWRTTKEAKQRLGIVAIKREGKAGKWFWGLSTRIETLPV